MERCRHGRSLGGRVFGLFFFLVLMGALNWAAQSSTDLMLLGAVRFLDANFWLIVLLSVLGIIGAFFRMLPFPIGLPAPIFYAFRGLFFVLLFFNIMDFFGIGVFRIFGLIIYPLVFVVALIGGYVEIFAEFFVPMEPPLRKREKAAHDWNDVGDEFREMMYEAFRNAKTRIRKRRRR